MSGYRQDWEALLTELHTRSEAATAMGGEARIERQHARGRLTARERIAALVDEGSFREYGLLAAGHHPQGQPAIAADGLVGGVARLDGRPVVLLVEDFTVQGGAIGHPNAAKRARLVRLARENRHPLLLLLEGAGERASNQGERYPHAPGDLQLLADIQGAIPVVALVLGMSAGHGALAAMFADIVIMQQDSALFSAGPPLVKAAMGIDTTAEELGSAKMHTRDSGVAHLCCATETECFARARHFLQMVCAPHSEAAAAGEVATSGDSDALLDIIPPDVSRPYDMRKVLDELADSGSLLELQPDFGRTLITALAHIGGQRCLIVANQPAVEAGAITRHAAEKASHFIDMAHRFSLPLVMLVSGSENNERRDLTADTVAVEAADTLFTSPLPGLLVGIPAPLYERDAFFGGGPASLPRTLIIHGTHDPNKPYEGARAHAERLAQAGEVSFTTVEGAAHFLPFVAPSCFVRAVSAFVDGTRALETCRP